MKPFNFSLSTVLQVRETEEQQARENHATAQEALDALLMQQRRVEEAIESNLAACRQSFEGQVRSGTIAHLQAALRELRVQLEVFQPEVQRLSAEVQARWQELLHARRAHAARARLDVAVPQRQLLQLEYPANAHFTRGLKGSNVSLTRACA